MDSRETPKTSILTYGLKSLADSIMKTRYARYRNEAIFSIFMMFAFAVFLVLALNILSPPAGKLVETAVSYQLGVMGQVVSVTLTSIAIILEVATGFSLGAIIGNLSKQGYYTVLSPYISVEYKPLTELEKSKIVTAFNQYDMDLMISRRTVQDIADELLVKASAYPDINKDLLAAYKLMFQGKITQLMAHHSIREVVLHEAALTLPAASAKALIEKYRGMYKIPCRSKLGFDFPRKGIFFYGVHSLICHVQDLHKYRKRRGRAVFCSIGILAAAGAFFYFMMYALPKLYPSTEVWLEDTLYIKRYNVLWGLVGAASSTLGASIGQFIFVNIFNLCSKLCLGFSDPSFSTLKQKDVNHINRNMPFIRRRVGNDYRVVLDVETANQIKDNVMAYSYQSRVSHFPGLVDFVHGYINKAFQHPRTGPLLIQLCFDDPELQIAALEANHFLSEAAVTASREVEKQIREVDLVRQQWERTLSSERNLREELESAQTRNADLKLELSAVLAENSIMSIRGIPSRLSQIRGSRTRMGRLDQARLDGVMGCQSIADGDQPSFLVRNPVHVHTPSTVPGSYQVNAPSTGSLSSFSAGTSYSPTSIRMPTPTGFNTLRRVRSSTSFLSSEELSF